MNKQIVALLIIGILLFSCKTKKVTETEKTNKLTESKMIDFNRIRGHYYITSMAMMPDLNSVIPTVKVEKTGNIGGFNGCNSYFGKISNEGGPLFTNIGSTRRGCQGEASEMEKMMMESLRCVTHIEREGKMIKLLKDTEVMLTGREVSLEGGMWQVLSPEGVKKSLLPSFEVREGKMNGNTGCNSFFAMVKQNDFNLEFAEIGRTEMICDGFDMEKESNFFTTLSSVTDFKLEGNIAIFYENGKELFKAENPR